MHLKRIGGVYYYIARVPKDLIGLLDRKELKKSLKTRDRQTAKTAARAYTAELERLGVYARSGVMDDLQLQRLLQKFKDGFLRGIEGAREIGATTYDVLDRSVSGKPIPGLDVNAGYSLLSDLFGSDGIPPDADEALRRYMLAATATAAELKPGAVFDMTTRWEARKFVTNNKLDVPLPPDGWFDPNDDQWHEPIKGEFLKLIRRLLQTKIDCYSIEIQRLQGNYSNPYDSQVRTRRDPLLLSDAIQRFCDNRRHEHPDTTDETERRYRMYFDVMLEIMGDRDVTEYSRQDLLNLKESLYQRPKNKSKGQKDAPPLDKRTVNTNYVGKIGSLFRWLHANDFVDRDITYKLVTSLTATERRERKRKAYDYDDLKKIFDLLPFDPKQPHLAWVPLLAAFSGARQGEICQLLVSDIKEAHGIQYMHLTEEDDNGNVVKTLKNENSRRLVPIHPALVRLGFLDFVAAKKAAGKTTLFETRIKGQSGFKPLTGQYYSKLFQAYNRKHVTDDPKKVFHSFRHLVHNELKQRMVPPDLYHAITGHVPQHEMDQVYTEDFKLQNKYDALMQLDYPCLDLAVLTEKYKTVIV